MPEFKLITLDPGHFHAGLIQKEMYAGVSPQVHVYAPLGPDLIEHLGRISRFNARPENPTAWRLEVHTGPDFLERMCRERPGNIVVISGRNRGKIERIRAALDAGLNVLADKPWIIRSADLPKLAEALDLADQRGLVAYDIMTERFEITSILQRELVQDPDVFGERAAGTLQEPGVSMESVHHLYKAVAGVPNLRPAWFFDIAQQGEALSDVGTHLVDLVQWTLFPNQAVDFRREIELTAAARWPTVLSLRQFQQATAEAAFPRLLEPYLKGGNLEYFCNTRVSYAIRGIHARLDVLWNYEAPAGTGDTYFAVFRGTRARVEIRQGKEESYRPELFVVPASRDAKAQVLAAARHRITQLAVRFPGLGVEDRGERLHISIPDGYRVGHEAHFAQVTNQFFGYLRDPKTLPAWEKPDMLAKYLVSTKGVELSQLSSRRA
ncbi:MAG TPA: putative oxidoreductase C-terminal domain-containing protein [Bryobacteraceae bacterium]|nr:putative oxidoreductase C-terminal domain-containing protein [Bryobacteraceae bacterium]